MPIHSGPHIVKEGLVMSLDAGDRNSYPGNGNTWYDLSGKNNNVTAVNGPVWSSNGYFANDVDSYFIGDGNKYIPTGNTPYTMLVWARQPSVWGANSGLISVGGYGTMNQSNALRTVNSSPGNFWHYWWNNDIGLADTSITLNEWFMVAATFDGTYRRLWTNGINRASDVPINHNVLTTTIQISITYYGEYQNGDVAIAKIYNRALNDKEMMQEYSSHKSRFNLT